MSDREDRVDEFEDFDEFVSQFVKHERLVEALRRKITHLEERIEELEQDDQGGSPDGRDLENLLPIERWVVARKNGENLSANIERASFVWEAFQSHARRDRGKLRLSSDQIENILVHDPDGPEMTELNRNTRVRVMKWVARGTGDADDPAADSNLIKLGGRDKKTLVADADEFHRHMNAPDDPVSPENGQGEGSDAAAEADAELERISQAAVTDGGEEADRPDENDDEGVSVTLS